MKHEFRMNLDVPERHSLGKRLEEVAWALFLIMTGVLWLAPEVWAPEGTWLTGVGLILLGLNAARYLYRLRINALGIVVGSVALVAGIGRVLGGKLPFAPLLLVVLGTVMILKAVSRTEQPEAAGGASMGGPCC